MAARKRKRTKRRCVRWGRSKGRRVCRAFTKTKRRRRAPSHHPKDRVTHYAGMVGSGKSRRPYYYDPYQ